MDEFAEERRTFYAVCRCLEIISEAARRLEESVRDRHQGLPWSEIMGLGNVYRHDYDRVAEERVWRTVQERLPELIEAMRREIGS